MEFSEINGFSQSKTKKKLNENFSLHEFIPHHHTFLKDLNAQKEETLENILKDIEETTNKHYESYPDKETFSETEIPFERFENFPRSKTEDFCIKKHFTKIKIKEIIKNFNENGKRRKSTLSRSLSFRKVYKF